MDKDRSPLSSMEDKQLVKFAYNSKNKLVGASINLELIRRMKETIENFSKESSKQTRIVIKLTQVIITLTVILGILALIQAFPIIKQFISTFLT